LTLTTGRLPGTARVLAEDLLFPSAPAVDAATGAPAVLRGSHPERLAREALFLLAFGSRPGIKAALARRLGAQTLTAVVA
jgi:hypothetical protein